MKCSKWERRIERADELCAALPFATQVLQFYKLLAGLQKSLYLTMDEDRDQNRTSIRRELAWNDLGVDNVVPRFAHFLSILEKTTFQAIAYTAQHLHAQPERWIALLSSMWKNAPQFRSDLNKGEDLLVLLFLQPHAECLADRVPAATRAHANCPFCSGKPQVGVLRPDGNGARRFLICSVCSTEWTYARVGCPACGEEAADKLAMYTAHQFNYVRIEACDTCGRYIKTIDLTKNGLAVPVVDELATIPLNLWAYEQGYVKFHPNLLGI